MKIEPYWPEPHAKPERSTLHIHPDTIQVLGEKLIQAYSDLWVDVIPDSFISKSQVYFTGPIVESIKRMKQNPKSDLLYDVLEHLQEEDKRSLQELCDFFGKSTAPGRSLSAEEATERVLEKNKELYDRLAKDD